MIKSKLMQGLSLARSGVYFLESLPFTLVNRYLTKADLPPPTQEQLTAAWKQIVQLHEREAQNLANHVYPASALEIENPLRHALSFLEVLGDGFRVAWRMRSGKTKDFSSKTSDWTKELPEYYARNFHFQTDGYLSEASARRYDHQVEILFTGAAGAMRRLILPPLKRNTSGSGRWLELGCGSGSATRAVLETFPKVHITGVDLSAPYLKVAQSHLRAYDRVDFLRGDVTRLDFRDETFDAVFSVYLLHELPRREREQVLREAYRVLRPGGTLVFADSLQMDEEPELNWALERFPRVYHEPFYKDYLGDRLEDLMARVTGGKVKSDHAFFTKVVWARKPESPPTDA